MKLLFKLLLGFYCSYKTQISMSKLPGLPTVTSDTDPNLISYLSLENAVFKDHYAWIVNKFLGDESVATGFPTPALPAVTAAATTAINAVPGVATIAQALGLTTPTSTPAASSPPTTATK
jgi:hypothetical protein